MSGAPPSGLDRAVEDPDEISDIAAGCAARRAKPVDVPDLLAGRERSPVHVR